MTGIYYFDRNVGYQKIRKLSYSFDTLEEAQAFANGKENTDIFISKNRYKVTWIKRVDFNDRIIKEYMKEREYYICGRQYRLVKETDSENAF